MTVSGLGISAMKVATAACLCAALWLSAFAGSAEATKYVDRVVAGTAASGSGEGEFDEPTAIAINDPSITDATTDPLGNSTDGYVYVADIENHRIQVFGPDDSFKFTFGAGVLTGANAPEVCDSSQTPCQAGVSGDKEGQFATHRHGIAINQETGDLYVSEGVNKRVQQFAADGSFIRAWGWGVDTGASAFEICTSTCRAGIDGSSGGQFRKAFFNTGLVAVDPAASHHVFVGDPKNLRIQEFEPDGTFVRLWGFNVVAEGEPGDLGSKLEICTTTDPGVCQAGENVSASHPATYQNGKILSANNHGPLDIAIDADGVLYAGNGHLDKPAIFRFDTDASNPVDLLLPEMELLGVDGFGRSSSKQPRNLAIDPDSGNLLVTINHHPEDPRTVELADPAGDFTHVDTHLSGSGLDADAVAVNPATAELYATSTTGGHRLFAADEDGSRPAAVSFIDPATGIGPHSATFTGCVDPLGTNSFTASYRFQYSTDGINWTDASDAVDLGLGPIDCDDPANEVTATATGLLANTQYRARMVTNRQFGNPDIPSQTEISFVTDALPPEVATFRPSHRTDTTAVLTGTVNPHGTYTTFGFEWGRTEAYGNKLPVPDAPVAPTVDGGTAQPQARLLEGLEPETTYHYRLCADSSKGSSCGEDRSFTTRPAFEGLAERAYEQVTRSRLGAVLAAIMNGGRNAAINPVAADGDAIAFREDGFTPDDPFGDSRDGTTSATPVVSQRTGKDWETFVPMGRPGGTSLGKSVGFHFLDSESRKSLVFTDTGWHDDPDSVPGSYLHDLGSGADTLVFAKKADGAERAATADLSHIARTSGARLIPNVGPGAFVDKVYEWVDGELRLVSVDESGDPFMASSQIGGPLVGGEDDLDAISEDGRHIFFSSPRSAPGAMPFGSSIPDATKVYRRTDGETTALASPSKRTPADPAGERANVYHAASADGDRVFFSSAELLTDDANTGPTREGRDLYRYELSTDTLVNLSSEQRTDDGARVGGFLGSSKDGRWAYYVAFGEVIDGQGVEGKPNVYAWHDDDSAGGERRFIATLGEAEADTESYRDRNDGGHRLAGRRSHVSADGSTLVFQSAEPLTGQPTRGHTQVYAYEADGDGGAGALSCASCRPDGRPSLGAAAVGAVILDGSRIPPLAVDGNAPAVVSADGGRVFFHTDDALLPEDENSASDVYLWEQGRLALISSGTGEGDAYYLGTDPSGDNAFFWSPKPLVDRDYGDLYDIYTARVGGGLVVQNPPPPGEPCAGEECKPAMDQPAEFTPPPSSTTQSEGNFTPPFHTQRLTAGQLRRLARRGRVAIRVVVERVERPGRIVVRALRGDRVMGAGREVAVEPGQVPVLLRLGPVARRILQHRGKLPLRVEVHFAGEIDTTDVVLKQRSKAMRLAKRLIGRAQALRQQARKTAARGDRPRAIKLHRRATRLIKASQRLRRQGPRALSGGNRKAERK